MRVLALIVVLLCLAGLSQQAMPEDTYWRSVHVFRFGWDNNNATIWLAAGNLTFWKALAVFGDNSTDRPSNETQLINYVNDTWCLGNNSCMEFMPKNDIRFYYFTEYTERYNLTSAHPYFWMWVTRKTFTTNARKFVTCRTNYFPRWDWLYMCQGFMPSLNNNYFYGVRWFCGSNNYLFDCPEGGYKLPGGYNNGNMTAMTSVTAQVFVECCFRIPTVSTPYIP